MSNSIAVCEFTLTTDYTTIRFPIAILGFSALVRGNNVLIRGIGPGAYSYLDAAAVVDAGGGLVQIDAAGHGLGTGAGIVFALKDTTNYDGQHTSTAGTTVDMLEFEATYVAETILATAYAIGHKDITLPAGTPWNLDLMTAVMQALFQAKSATGTAYLSMIVRK